MTWLRRLWRWMFPVPAPMQEPLPEDDGFSYEAWHTKGKNPCGKLAFTCIRHPRITNASSNVLLPNGEHPYPCSYIACGSCGAWLGERPELRQVERIQQ